MREQSFETDRPTCLAIRVHGIFAIVAPDGLDLVPRGSKACALIAMLFLSPDKKRTRRWIESKLWSTRSDDQASASLRQSLSEIRRSFGIYSDAIVADRREVWLEKSRWQSIESFPEGQVPTLLEGLRVRDPKFDEWLLSVREKDVTRDEAHQKLGGDSLVATVPRSEVYLNHPQDLSQSDELLHELFSSQVSRNLAECTNVKVIARKPKQSVLSTRRKLLSLESRSWDVDNQRLLMLKLIDLCSGEILWSKSARLSGSVSDLMCGCELYQLAEEAVDNCVANIRITNDRTVGIKNVDAILQRAFNEMFTFDSARLRIADSLFKAAIDLDSHPSLLAWRSYLRIPMWIERLEDACEPLADQARDYSDKAVSLSPNNSLVLAIASQTYLTVCRDLTAATAFSRDAISLNPGGAIPNLSAALCHLRAGEIDLAKKFADRSLALSLHAPHRHWWNMVSCVVDIAAGDFNSAISKGERCLAYAPRYRPPLRHLYALYIAVGRIDKAIEVFHRLRELEPYFSLHHMRSHDSYPSTTLRSTGLIELQDVVDPS